MYPEGSASQSRFFGRQPGLRWFPLPIKHLLWYYLCSSREPQGVCGANIGSGWGRGLVAGVQRKRVSFGEGAGSKRMLGNEVRVKSLGTDVMRGRCARIGVVCRCVSAADSSLSLSLSRTLAFLR